MGENHCTPKQHGSWNFWGVVETLMAQTVKNLPAMRETQVWSLGWEDPLEWLPTPLFLPGEFHEQKSLSGYSLWGCKESDMTEWLTEKIYDTESHFFFFFSERSKKMQQTCREAAPRPCGSLRNWVLCFQIFPSLSAGLPLVQARGTPAMNPLKHVGSTDHKLMRKVSVQEIFQARILKWVATSFSKWSSLPRDQTEVSVLQADSLPSEPPGKLHNSRVVV